MTINYYEQLSQDVTKGVKNNIIRMPDTIDF